VSLRAQCTKATLGQGRSLHIREDEQFQQKLRTKMQTQRGRASLRKRTAVEHTIAHQLAHQGRRARYKGMRKNQFEGRRHAAVSNLQIAAHYDINNSLTPLMGTMTPFGYMAPQSKGMCILQTYIEFLH
jgi:Transposase DDE domain